MEYDFKTLQTKVEAEMKATERIIFLNDARLPDENRNAKDVSTRIRCPQLIPEMDGVKLVNTLSRVVCTYCIK